MVDDQVKTAEQPAASTPPAPQESPHAPPAASSFETQAEEAPPGIIAEFWDFLKYNKKWWLTPIIIVLLLLGLLIFAAGSGAVAPFIYPIF